MLQQEAADLHMFFLEAGRGTQLGDLWSEILKMFKQIGRLSPEHGKEHGDFQM